MRNTIVFSTLICIIGCVKSSPVLTTQITPTPVVTIPNAPKDLKGILSSFTQIDLTWSDASNNEDGFKVERKSGTDAFTLIATLDQNVVTYFDKGLVDATNYTYRIFSYNQKGNSSNSNEISLATLATSIKDIDGNKYNIVAIGQQVWTDKNLEVITYLNGDVIPQVTDASKWASLTTGAWCYYNNDPASGVIYGKLYNWYAVNDSRGLAPKGWHIPSDAEWTTLGTFLGGDSVAGGKMKTTGTSRWYPPNFGATNQSGFAGLPAGIRVGNEGAFSCCNVGDSGYWWSASESSSTSAFYRYMVNTSGYLARGGGLHKSDGFSVRCIRD